MSMKLTDVIRRPLITEKTSILREDGRTIVFEVAPGANKIEIKRAVEQLLGSKVASIRTSIAHGKIKRQGRFAGQRPDWKKAYVTLREGEKMPEFLEGRVRLMPIRKVQPDVAGPAVPDRADLRRDHDVRSRTSRSSSRCTARGGRNNRGELTSWWRGGGHKRMYRIIDFKRDKRDIPAKVSTIEYDPNRSARIALLTYADGEKRYILQPIGLKVGDTIVAGANVDILPGNALPLKNIPLGTLVHNVELKPGKGGQIARSAGSSVQLVAKEGDYASVKMPSGEIRKIFIECYATIGQVGNLDHENVSIGKAGRSRWLGKRPHVRGVAMNPVDHPLGGGEGKTSGGRHPVSPWGLPTKGYKTRNRKTTDKFIVQRGRSSASEVDGGADELEIIWDVH